MLDDRSQLCARLSSANEAGPTLDKNLETREKCSPNAAYVLSDLASIRSLELA